MTAVCADHWGNQSAKSPLTHRDRNVWRLIYRYWTLAKVVRCTYRLRTFRTDSSLANADRSCWFSHAGWPRPTQGRGLTGTTELDNKVLRHIYAVINNYNCNCLIKFNCVSVLHIPIVHAHDVSKQIPWEFCTQSENKVHLHAWIHLSVFWPI